MPNQDALPDQLPFYYQFGTFIVGLLKDNIMIIAIVICCLLIAFTVLVTFLFNTLDLQIKKRYDFRTCKPTS
jgi:hypothetical protein